MNVFAFLVALLLSQALCAQWLKAGAHSRLRVPVGFHPVEDGRWEHTAGGAAITLHELGIPYAIASERSSLSRLRSKGYSTNFQQSTRALGGTIQFTRFLQTVNAGTFITLLLLVGDSTQTVMLTGTVPDGADSLEWVVKRSLFTMEYRDAEAEQPRFGDRPRWNILAKQNSGESWDASDGMLRNSPSVLAGKIRFGVHPDSLATYRRRRMEALRSAGREPSMADSSYHTIIYEVELDRTRQLCLVNNLIYLDSKGCLLATQAEAPVPMDKLPAFVADGALRNFSFFFALSY